jgi:xylulokinase
MTPAHLARAAIEGILCGLSDALDALRAAGAAPERLYLIGGAAASPAVQQIAATVFEVPAGVPARAEYVALGAARQAAWALTGTWPDWPSVPVRDQDPVPAAHVRDGYAAARALVYS